MSDREWLSTWYEHLLEIGDRLHKRESESFEAGAWSLNKLAYLGAYAKEIFETVGGKHFDRLYYVDLLAGSGLTSYEDRAGENRAMAGSALAIPTLVNSFERVFVNDINEQNIRLLQDRVENLSNDYNLPDYEFYNGDANDVASDIISSVFDDGIQGALTLTFVDNEALDVGFKAISELGSIYNDIFILYPTMSVWRSIRQAEAQDHEARKLRSFFGDRSWEGSETEIDAMGRYVNKIIGSEMQHDRVSGPKPEIKGPGGHRYHIMCSVRETPSGSGFLEGAKRQSERVDGMAWEELLNYVDVAQPGGQLDLDHFGED